MTDKVGYGQFCPLAMAAEFLCTRWSILVFRELLLGASAFNDICRGVPRMSRTLLSSRLKEFVERGLLVKDAKAEPYAQYKLTPAGEALRPVIFGMADWSQEWLQMEPALDNIDVDHLMWDIRRSARSQPELPDPFIAHIYFPEQEKKLQNFWLVIKAGEVDVCIVDQDYEVTVQVQCSAETLTKIWMGWSSFAECLTSGVLLAKGPKEVIRIAPKWLGSSRLASIKKQPFPMLVS